MIPSVTDEQFLWFYDSASEAISKGCEGCSMIIFNFREKYPALKSYQMVYFYGRLLRDCQFEGKTVYLAYRKLKTGDIVTWNLVPNGYEAEFKKTSWRNKKWLEIQKDGTKKEVFY